MFYISQEKVASIHGYAGSRVLVQYYTFRGKEAFEADVETLQAALELIDVLRRYDSHLDFHDKTSTFCPFADLLQLDEEGRWVTFGYVQLPREPPWARPRKR